jgi:hypothetical protein
MLENSLPLLGNTSAGANVLSQGVSRGFHSVPVIQSPLLPEACSWIKLHAGKIPVFF